MSWPGSRCSFIHFSVQVAPPDISILAACASDFYSSFYRAAKLRSKGVGCKQKKLVMYVCACSGRVSHRLIRLVSDEFKSKSHLFCSCQYVSHVRKVI